KRLMLYYFGVSLFGQAVDLIPSSLVSDAVVYIILLVYLFCTGLLLAACINWMKSWPKQIALFVSFLLLTALSPNTDSGLLYVIGVYTLVCYGSLLRVFISAYQRGKNIGYLFLALACAVVVVGALYHLQLTYMLQYAAAAQVVSAYLLTAACLVGVGYLMVLQGREQRLLSRLAIVDPLTELLNRRGLAELFPLRLGTFSGPWCEAAVDIDHFKKVNDNFGHDVGDQVIRQVAQVLRQEARETDLLCRFGGEEFIVVLFRTSNDAAQKVMERVRQSIANRSFSAAGSELNSTVSIGIATGAQQDIQLAIKVADTALYQAKANGRNCVVMAEH
ncbi:MAG TPA: GGDEF domain-containing protein, partial [Rheinheimera sp.]|nr:GGDEF domain-containing protein [Rheinheimera sp.]